MVMRPILPSRQRASKAFPFNCPVAQFVVSPIFSHSRSQWVRAAWRHPGHRLPWEEKSIRRLSNEDTYLRLISHHAALPFKSTSVSAGEPRDFRVVQASVARAIYFARIISSIPDVPRDSRYCRQGP